MSSARDVEAGSDTPSCVQSFNSAASTPAVDTPQNRTFTLSVVILIFESIMSKAYN